MASWPCGHLRLMGEGTGRGEGASGEKSGLISLLLVQECFPKALRRTMATSGQHSESNASNNRLFVVLAGLDTPCVAPALPTGGRKISFWLSVGTDDYLPLSSVVMYLPKTTVSPFSGLNVRLLLWVVFLLSSGLSTGVPHLGGHCPNWGRSSSLVSRANISIPLCLTDNPTRLPPPAQPPGIEDDLYSLPIR